MTRHLTANDNNIHAVNYTISAWDGGKNTFNYCSLQSRAPVYAGICTDAISYTLTAVDTAPYACTSFPNGTTLTGEDCTGYVDKQLDCIAVCECFEEDALLGTITRGCGENRCADSFLIHHCMRACWSWPASAPTMPDSTFARYSLSSDCDAVYVKDTGGLSVVDLHRLQAPCRFLTSRDPACRPYVRPCNLQQNAHMRVTVDGQWLMAASWIIGRFWHVSELYCNIWACLGFMWSTRIIILKLLLVVCVCLLCPAVLNLDHKQLVTLLMHNWRIQMGQPSNPRVLRVLQLLHVPSMRSSDQCGTRS